MVADNNVTLSLSKGMIQTEIGLIPEDWEVVELSQIGTFKNGINKGAEDFGFGSPFVNLMDVFGKNTISSNEAFGLVNSNNVERDIYNIKSGDVFFIRSSVKPSGVGKTALVKVDLIDTVYSGFLIRYRNSTLNNEFKRYCFDAEYFRNYVIAGSTVSANTNINQDTLKSLKLAYPKSKDEQQAIAKALSDADAWIESLEKLIAKKRLIKQGAMQELLTPKEDWEVKKLGEMSVIYTGKKNNQDKIENGVYPFFVRSQTVERINTYSFDGEAILIPGEGNLGSIVHYINGKFDFHQRVYKISNFNEVNGKYLYWYFRMYFGNHAMQNTVKATVDSIRLPTLQDFEISFPKLNEQTRIATILSDMDAELEALEKQLEKARQIKQGMMQELLTGRIRLV